MWDVVVRSIREWCGCGHVLGSSSVIIIVLSVGGVGKGRVGALLEEEAEGRKEGREIENRVRLVWVRG